MSSDLSSPGSPVDSPYIMAKKDSGFLWNAS